MLETLSQRRTKNAQKSPAIPGQAAMLVTYCDGGECDLSVELAKELIDRGYSNVFVFGEGYPGWEEAGYPVEKGEV
ncbi:MAG: rhodanese-like domain-containing protein [Armatimonadetes bacterium]|nr:rhodanese-like domain-containing protein [Armatimonadota bacterium]